MKYRSSVFWWSPMLLFEKREIISGKDLLSLREKMKKSWEENVVCLSWKSREQGILVKSVYRIPNHMKNMVQFSWSVAKHQLLIVMKNYFFSFKNFIYAQFYMMNAFQAYIKGSFVTWNMEDNLDLLLIH